MVSSESVSKLLESIQRIGIHINNIYHQMRQLELRADTLVYEIQQISNKDYLSREAFNALAQGLLCPALYERWNNIPKFLESVTLIKSSSPAIGVIQEISPRTNPEALTLLNRAVTLDCDWAKRILIKSDKERS